MLQVGKVIGARKGLLEICFERPEACQHCGACGGSKQLSAVKIPGDAPIGSTVAVEMPEVGVLRASLLAYVIPLCMLLAGVALGALLFQQEALAAVCGLGLMGASYLVLKAIDRKIKGRPGWQPKIVAVYKEGEMKHGTEAE